MKTITADIGNKMGVIQIDKKCVTLDGYPIEQYPAWVQGIVYNKISEEK